ncbi:unnamed protein product, partial [Owenia fusiformis]
RFFRGRENLKKLSCLWCQMKKPFGCCSSLQTLNTLSSGIGGSQPDLLSSPYGSNISIHHHHHTYHYSTYGPHSNFRAQTSVTENTYHVDNTSFHDASRTSIHNIYDSQNIQIGDGNVITRDTNEDKKADWRYYPNRGTNGGYYSDDDGGGYVVDDMTTPIYTSSPKASPRHLNNDDDYHNTKRPEEFNGVYDGVGYGTEREFENKVYGLNPSLREQMITSSPPPLKKYSNLERASSLNAIWNPNTGNQSCGIGARPKDSFAGRSVERPVRQDERAFIIPRPQLKKNCSNVSLAESLKAYAESTTHDITKIGSTESINRQHVLQRSETSLDETSNKHWEDIVQRRQEQSRKKAAFLSNPDVARAVGWNSAWPSVDRTKAKSLATLTGPGNLYTIGEWETAV